MDKITPKQRSENMAKIRSKDSELELLFRKALWKKNFRYRKNVSGMMGKPDLVFYNRRTVIFLDSCFWHNCPIHGHMPKSNLKFWRKKLNENAKRDMRVIAHYEADGWRVMRIWEHDLTGINAFSEQVEIVSRALLKQEYGTTK